jgi:hypothetical protein
MELVLAMKDAIETGKAKGSPEVVVVEEAQCELLADRIRTARFTWVRRREFCREVLQAEKLMPTRSTTRWASPSSTTGHWQPNRR